MVPSNRLLIAIDDQSSCNRTLDYVSSFLSGHAGFEIELTQVLDFDDEAQEILTAAGERLIASGLARDGIRVSTVVRRVRLGVAEQLVEHAKQIGADTLVVGWDTCVHPAERFHRHLGERLAARARDVSLWIVRRGAPSASDVSILVALDDTTESDDTTAYIGRVLAGRNDVRIHLYRALEPVAPSPVDYVEGEDPVSTKALLEDAARERLGRAQAEAIVHLEAARERLSEAGVVADCVSIEAGDAFVRPEDVPDAIAEAAHAASCATLVVGCHALTWYGRLFQRHVGAELLDATRDLTLWIPA